MNERISRAQIRAICESLGHDPDRVHSIEINPAEVLVTYSHALVNDDGTTTDEDG